MSDIKCPLCGESNSVRKGVIGNLSVTFLTLIIWWPFFDSLPNSIVGPGTLLSLCVMLSFYPALLPLKKRANYKAKPQGAEGASWWSLALLMLIAYVVLVVSSMVMEGNVLLALVPGSVLPLLLYFQGKGLLQLWRNSSIRSRYRDKSASRKSMATGHFFVLLRPFDFDGAIPLMPTQSRYIEEFEKESPRIHEFNRNDMLAPVELFDALAHTLSSTGELIAIGERKQGHVGGPGLITLDGEDWRPRVASLMQDARYILLMPWPTAGTLWELNEVLGRGLVEKTVFIMPPSYDVKNVRRMISDEAYTWAGEEDFYYKLPVERLDPKDPICSVKERYLEAASLLGRAGLTMPEYDNDGCLFFYRSGMIRIAQIPYYPKQMADLIDRLRGE